MAHPLNPFNLWLTPIFLLLLAACGKVGDPLPPFIRIPEAVKDLAVRQVGHDLVLTWTNPARNIDSSAATNLARARILSGATTLAIDDSVTPGQPDSLAIPIGSSIGTPRSFAVQLETSEGKTSQASNSVSITPIEVPGPITEFRAVVDQHRIILEWQPPRERPELAHSYSVTRVGSGESIIVNETRSEDASYQRGQNYTYQITPVRREGEQVTFGVGPASVPIEAVDKTPPKVPDGLEAATGDNGGFITWNANEERDLSGYHVYRSDRPDGGWVQIGGPLHTSNGIFDPGYRSGLYYAVSAVDEFGNESARSAPLRVQ